jgi:hypothetical protein
VIGTLCLPSNGVLYAQNGERANFTSFQGAPHASITLYGRPIFCSECVHNPCHSRSDTSFSRKNFLARFNKLQKSIAESVLLSSLRRWRNLLIVVDGVQGFCVLMNAAAPNQMPPLRKMNP